MTTYFAPWREGTGTAQAIGLHLRIEGVDRLTGDIDIHTTVRLSGVISADLSFSPSLDTDYEMGRRAMYLMQAVPNERELDVSYVRARYLGLDLERLHPWCPRILKLTWKGANEKGKRNQHFIGIGGHWPFSIVVSRRLRIW